MTPLTSSHLPTSLARPAAKPEHYQPPRTSKRRLTFFERTWADFPLGRLPLDLLARLSTCLVALAASERTYFLPPRLKPDQSPLANRFSLLYRPDTLQTASRSDLEHFLRNEEEDLLCIILTAPSRKANPYLHRELLLFAIRRLGQVYGECKKRWTAKEARAMVLAQTERLWSEWQHCCTLLLVFALPPQAQAAFRTVGF